MNGVMRRIVILVGALSLLALPLVAAADEGDESIEGDPAPTEESQFVYHYDSLVHLLTYGFFAPGTDPETCTPATTHTEPTEGTLPSDTDGETIATGELESCSELNVEGRNGQLNHGTFVSTLVHAMKAGFEGGMPIGKYIREFAKSDLGKGDHAKGSGGQDGLEADDEDGPGSGKPPKGSKTNNGNGHGKNGA